jgi:hypothetical protein
MQTATDPDGGTITLDRVATGLQFSLTPQVIGGVLNFTGGPQGGSIGVNDTYGSPVTGTQTASGPTLPYPQAGKAAVGQVPGTCDYAVLFQFAIATTSSGTFPPQPDGGVLGLADTPVIPIPSDLKLCGTATVPWEGQPGSGKGFYETSGFLGQGDEWRTTFDKILSLGGQPPGFATISWCFSPTLGPPNSCSAGGGTIASAAANPLAVAAQLCGLVPLKCISTPPQRGECPGEWARRQAMKEAARQSAAALSEVKEFTAVMAGLFTVAAKGALTPSAASLLGVSTAAYVLQKYFEVVAKHDPPDLHWRSIVKAKPIGPLSVPAGGFLGPAGTATLDGILRQTATLSGLVEGFDVSNNRESSAKAAHSSLWVKRQIAAMGRFAVQAAQTVDQLITLIQESKSTLSIPFPGLTPTPLQRAAKYVRAHGLPRSLLNLATKYRIPTSLLHTIERKLKSGAALPSYATSIYGILSNPALINADQAVATALRAYGQLLLAAR